jgi:hypothetical protein
MLKNQARNDQTGIALAERKPNPAYLYAGWVIVIAAVLIIVGTGVYAERFRPLQASVIKVGDASYSMDYYVNMLAYYGATTGSDFIYYVTDQAAQQIQMNRLIKDAAEKLDPPVTVSDRKWRKSMNGAGRIKLYDVVRVN